MKALVLRTDFYGHISQGGSFSHIKGFLDSFTKLGHEYVAVSSGRLPVEREVVQIPYPTLFRNIPEIQCLAYNFKLIRAVRKIIELEHPDFLYHRHSEFNYASSVLSAEFGIPLVLEYNGSEVWVKKHWGKLYLERHCRMAEELQLERAYLVCVVSDVIARDLIAKGIDRKKILVNPNGVDPQLFRPSIDGSIIKKRYHWRKNNVIAGFVGTFGQWHGIEVLARAIRPVVKQNRNVRFLIVGEGTLRPEVERIIAEDRVEDYVVLTGSVQHSEIPLYLAASDLLLSPHVDNSDGTEFFGSPTKLFEYMAMGKPIIASAVGQIESVIKDGVNGLLIKPQDPLDLAEKILQLAENKRIWKKLGNHARNDAVRKFSWEKNASRVIHAVGELTRRSS